MKFIISILLLVFVVAYAQQGVIVTNDSKHPVPADFVNPISIVIVTPTPTPTPTP